MTMTAPWTRVNFGGAETNQKRLGRKEPNNDHYRMRLSPGLPTNCVCGYRNWGTARAGIVAPAPDGAGAHAPHESAASGGTERRSPLQEEIVAGSRTTTTGSVPVSPVGEPATTGSAGVAGPPEPDDRGVDAGD